MIESEAIFLKDYKGLSSREAKEILIKNGPNCLKEDKQKTVWQMFAEQIWNFTNLILAAAIVISIILGDYGEAAIIGVIVIINAIIGVIQEGKAQKALEALKRMSILRANVIRDGEKREISSEELVIGDIVTLEAGQQVPADLKLIETINLKVDEKALTGESVAVEKDCDFKPSKDSCVGDRLDLAYMSTIITYGRGVGEVINTGMDTEIGKIAEMVGKEKSKPSPLQKAMDGLSKLLGVAAIIICIIMFIVGVIQQRNMLDMLMTAVSLAVAAIPEGIPTIVTIVLALGMQRMAKINAIVKTLPAVETLGSVSYVCSDKTGTLTQNKMTVVKAYADGEYIDLDKMDTYKYKTLIDGFLLCNDAVITKDNKEIGDPTETALVAFAKKYDILKADAELRLQRINEFAFDSDRKLMTTVHEGEGKIISFTKGSTDELLKRCTKIMINGQVREINDGDIKEIYQAMQDMSDEALRVLSMAIRYNNKDAIEQDLIYVGMVGMIDPERVEVVDSVATFKRAGVKTVMITGDHKDTAFAIAKKLGIANNKEECIMGHELNKMTDDELKEKVKTISIFARVSPEHKVRIVKALQDNGFVVSMTGDGVNDSPSLKAADVGVAMGITGTDVAKGAADIVLQDDSFTTIEKAIKEGRNIYENIKKSILFAVSSNISEVLTMFTAIVVGLAAPLKAVQILWVNLLTDSLPCFALGVDTNSSSDVMSNPPRKENESIFTNGGYKIVGIYSVLITLLTLGSFLYPAFSHLISNNISFTWQNIIDAYSISNVLSKAGTYAFCVLAVSQLFHAIGMRDVSSSVFKFKFSDNKLMILAFLVGYIGQILVVSIPFMNTIFGTTPISIMEWVGITLVSAIPLIMHEILIPFQRKKYKSEV